MTDANDDPGHGRPGGVDDPVPDAEYGDQDAGELPPHVDPFADFDISPSIKEAARRLAAPGLLTPRQALAYVLRDVEGVPRQEAADRMNCSTSTLDGHLGTAREKSKTARATVDALDRLEATDGA